MFGLLSPARRDANFCRTYTHLCKSHRRAAGISLLGFHSYESVLVYLLAADARLVSLNDKPTRICCRLQKQSALTPEDERISRFCSYFSTLLAHIKLTDNVSDESSIRARLILSLMSRRFAAAYEFFSEIDPNFRETIAAILKQHADMERDAVGKSIAEFSGPTGDGFGYLFSLVPRLRALPALEKTFCEIGRHAGRAIVAFDVGCDYRTDRLAGDYNPLPNETHIPNALEYAKRSLLDAAAIAESAFGLESLAAGHLRSVESSFVLDGAGAVTQTPSVLDDSLLQNCTPAKAFGLIPLPFLADSSSSSGNDAGCVLGAIAVGACICINAVTKNSCLGRTEGRRDMCGNVTVQRKGPCE